MAVGHAISQRERTSKLREIAHFSRASGLVWHDKLSQRIGNFDVAFLSINII